MNVSAELNEQSWCAARWGWDRLKRDLCFLGVSFCSFSLVIVPAIFSSRALVIVVRGILVRGLRFFPQLIQNSCYFSRYNFLVSGVRVTLPTHARWWTPWIFLSGLRVAFLTRRLPRSQNRITRKFASKNSKKKLNIAHHSSSETKHRRLCFRSPTHTQPHSVIITIVKTAESNGEVGGSRYVECDGEIGRYSNTIVLLLISTLWCLYTTDGNK